MLGKQETMTNPIQSSYVDHDSRAGKYLIFQLANEEFGMAVLKVREIIKIQDITPVPQTPHFVKGVINLRGKVIPVIDLRMKFGLPDRDYTEHTCIIVVRANSTDVETPMGVVVDGVVEVLNVSAPEIEDTPDFGDGAMTPGILGMAKIKGRVNILLDMEQVLNAQELNGFASTIH